MRVAVSPSDGRIHGTKKRPPDRRWSAAEGLTTRRRSLLMAGTHLMYLCPSMFGTLSSQEGCANG